jgi:mannitol/fructose-specific phosphotransferase system IIA component (Ntr-type)
VTTISELLLPEAIRLNLKEKRKKRVLAELTELLASAWNLDNPKALTAEILNREKMGSTGIGHGIALPHCLTSLSDRTMIAFGRSPQGISYGAADNRSVTLLFLLVGPQSATSEHLKLLSKLSRLLTEEQFRGQLMEAGEPGEIIELFRRREEA